MKWGAVLQGAAAWCTRRMGRCSPVAGRGEARIACCRPPPGNRQGMCAPGCGGVAGVVCYEVRVSFVRDAPTA